ncbi:bifunctional DNA primase/polymerase [Paractinoplanes globisporus]|uniref:Bifunctional DNA primase/polymerase n=1 Tax=Paractinoplanes globisporus TaxID=113565 RepID=A0ABW6WEZ2_9ACTN|nr:bifunctional DNA primase/polymerase [Actinoplanes globisporus]
MVVSSARRTALPGWARSLAGAAARYAAAGIEVLPLHTPAPGGGCSCRDGAACPSPGKHPRLHHGLRDASRAPAAVAGWWRRWPQANIGLVTGTVLDVCDIDTNDGLHAVLDLLDVARPPGPLIRTGAGWHLWYAADGLPSRVGLLPGVDWRGRGGLVVAPPSRHASGARYTFQQPWHLHLALPACPPQLRTLVQPPPPGAPRGDRLIADLDRYTQAALDGELQRIRNAPRPTVRSGRRITAGGRNNALNIAAFRLGQLAARGPMDEAAVRRHLADTAMAAGLGREETERTIASGWEAGLRQPRRRPAPAPAPARS